MNYVDNGRDKCRKLNDPCPTAETTEQTIATTEQTIKTTEQAIKTTEETIMVRQAGINLENVKIRNRASILELLNRQGAMSRKDIAQQLGLTSASLTKLTTTMIEEGILQETGEFAEEKRAGRRKILVDIVENYKYVLSISIEQKKTYISLVDLKGKQLAETVIKTRRIMQPEDFLAEVIQTSQSFLWSNNIKQEQILGVGVCVPGTVDRQRGVSVKAFGIWNREVEIRKILEDGLGCPVILENNIQAFAEAEMLFGLGKTGDNLLFVKWGPGVGSAIVINNQVYVGKKGMAAEIGHYLINQPEEDLCISCGNGTLESEISIDHMLEQIRRIYSSDLTPHLYEVTGGDMDKVSSDNFTAFMEGHSQGATKSQDAEANDSDADVPENQPCFAVDDKLVVEMLQKNIRLLAHALDNVMTMLAPDYTILCGSLMENEDVRNYLKERCHAEVPEFGEDDICLSELNLQSHYIAGAAVIVKELFLEQGGC